MFYVAKFAGLLHPHNIFLQVFDDGRLTDGQGRTVDFTNAVVIMTSNLGSGGTEEQVMTAVRNHFKPEFLNRIDEIVVFHRLSQDDITQIVRLQVARLRDRLADTGRFVYCRILHTAPVHLECRWSKTAHDELPVAVRRAVEVALLVRTEIVAGDH